MVTPVSMASEVHEAIAGAELVVVLDAAHLATLDQPDALNGAFTGFLRRLSGGDQASA